MMTDDVKDVTVVDATRAVAKKKGGKKARLVQDRNP